MVETRSKKLKQKKKEEEQPKYGEVLLSQPPPRPSDKTQIPISIYLANMNKGTKAVEVVEETGDEHSALTKGKKYLRVTYPGTEIEQRTGQYPLSRAGCYDEFSDDLKNLKRADVIILPENLSNIPGKIIRTIRTKAKWLIGKEGSNEVMVAINQRTFGREAHLLTWSEKRELFNQSLSSLGNIAGPYKLTDSDINKLIYRTCIIATPRGLVVGYHGPWKMADDIAFKLLHLLLHSLNRVVTKFNKPVFFGGDLNLDITKEKMESISKDCNFQILLAGLSSAWSHIDCIGCIMPNGDIPPGAFKKRTVTINRIRDHASIRVLFDLPVDTVDGSGGELRIEGKKGKSDTKSKAKKKPTK